MHCICDFGFLRFFYFIKLMYASIKYVCAHYGFISIIKGTYQIEGEEEKAVQP